MKNEPSLRQEKAQKFLAKGVFIIMTAPVFVIMAVLLSPFLVMWPIAALLEWSEEKSGWRLP